MSDKEKRGTKRTCQECEARFYDLNNTPITCPMCGVVFKLDETDAEPVVVEKPKPAPKPAPVAAEEKEDEAADPVEDELAEIEADDSDDASDEEDNTFLETEDDDTNVSDMLGTTVTKGEEET